MSEMYAIYRGYTAEFKWYTCHVFSSDTLYWEHRRPYLFNNCDTAYEIRDKLRSVGTMCHVCCMLSDGFVSDDYKVKGF